MVSINIYTNEIPAKFTVQPFVYNALDHYKPRIEKEIKKLSEQILVEKDNSMKLKLQEKHQNISALLRTYIGSNDVID